MERKRMLVLPSEVKAVGDAGGALAVEGVMTTAGLDRENEVVDTGGLTNLGDFGGVPLPLYYEHNRAAHIGHATEIKAQKAKLKVRSSLAGTELVRGTVWPLIENDSLKAYSIGFIGLDGDDIKGTWHWTEWRLMEHSLVSMPANLEATAQAAKSLGYEWGPMITKGVVEVEFPVCADHEHRWDAVAAERRVRAWAQAQDGPNEEYRSCFLWHDADDADSFAAYKLLAVDVIDGQPVVVWRALAGEVARLERVAIPAADKTNIRRVCAGLYEQFGKDFPEGDLDDEHKRITELNLFSENVRRLRGNAQAVYDILPHWQQASPDLLREVGWAEIEQAQELVGSALTFRDADSKSDDGGEGVSKATLENPLDTLAEWAR